MAHQEEGWPLGLRPVNARIGVIRRIEVSGSVSFSTLVTSSPSSSPASSSDLDTQSTGSFFHDKSITLGNLIGISSILELSRRSTRRRIEASRDHHHQKNNLKSYKLCLFSLCSKLTTDAVTHPTNSAANTQSLGHFLRAERRATASTR